VIFFVHFAVSDAQNEVTNEYSSKLCSEVEVGRLSETGAYLTLNFY